MPKQKMLEFGHIAGYSTPSIKKQSPIIRWIFFLFLQITSQESTLRDDKYIGVMLHSICILCIYKGDIITHPIPIPIGMAYPLTRDGLRRATWKSDAGQPCFFWGIANKEVTPWPLEIPHELTPILLH